MIEQLKIILLEKYNSKIEEYNNIKNIIIELEVAIANDNSEEVYKENLKELKKKKLKKNSLEYTEEYNKINEEYNKKVFDFKDIYNKYTEYRRTASLIDIYGFQRKIEKVSNAKELQDLNIDEEKATKILSGEVEDI